MELSYDIKIYKGIPVNDYHISSNIKIFSVLEGSAILSFEKEQHELIKGELYVVNFGKLYNLSSTDDTVIAILEIDYVKLLKASKNKVLKFYCNTSENNLQNHYQIKKIFSKLLLNHVVGDRKFEELGLFYQFIDLLISKYSQFISDDIDDFEDDTINKVCIYLQSHYMDKITIKEICDRFGYSTSTFTRNFKKHTNMSMIQYLNEIRIQSAKQLLFSKNSTVTEVALEVGYADSATFIKRFEQITGISPLKFKQRALLGDVQNINNDDLVKIVEDNFSNDDIQKNEYKIHHVNEISSQNAKTYKKSWNKGIGVQSASVLLNDQYRKDLLKIKKSFGLDYVRIPFILSDNIVQRVNSAYDFGQVDIVLDFIVQNHMIPILVLSRRKIAIVDHGVDLGIKEVGKYQSDSDKYQDLINEFIKHVFSRFTDPLDRVSEWIWEFERERTSYSINEYSLHFLQISKQLKRWNENYTFGGYGFDIYDWSEQEIAELAEQNFIPSFFSINLYPYELKYRKGSTKFLERCKSGAYLRSRMINLREKLNQYGYDSVPIYVTSWNTSLEDQSMINDSHIKSSQILMMVTSLMGLSDMFIYDYACDFKLQKLSDDKLLFGGRGLISKDGLEKSAFETMIGISSIGDKVSACNKNLLFTYLSPSNLIGICFNRKEFSMSYFERPENSIKADEMQFLYDDFDVLEQTINITDLKDGIYRIRLTIIDNEHSALTSLNGIGNDIQLGSKEIQFLKAQRPFDIKLFEKETSKGQLKFSIVAKPNAVVIINVFAVDLNV